MSYNYLAHHGILGQKWGVRRFQNKNGTYTEKGRKRHADDENEKSQPKTNSHKAKNVGKIIVKTKAKNAATDVAGGLAVVGTSLALSASGHQKAALALAVIGGTAITSSQVVNKAKAGKAIYDQITNK